MNNHIILFGSANFTVPVAEALHAIPDVALAAVVAQPDKPKGRGQVLASPPTKTWAETHGIPVVQPEKLDDTFLASLASFVPTIGIIASYGKIIPQSVLDTFPKGILNVHPSLLPKHRGATPIQTTILKGDTETGVTLMLTDAEMDHGPIIAQERFALSGTETSAALHDALAQLGARMLTDMFPKWFAGTITPHEQEHERATYTKALTREDGRVDWNGSAVEIERMVRAFDPWPGTFTVLPDGKRLKILEAKVVNGPDAEPGTLSAQNQLPVVRTADSWLALHRVQPEGKKPMNGKAFLSGYGALLEKQLS